VLDAEMPELTGEHGDTDTTFISAMSLSAAMRLLKGEAYLRDQHWMTENIQ
jgi:hypothetical protein